MSEMSGLDDRVVAIPAARKAAETAVLVRRYGGVPLVGSTMREIPAATDDVLLAATDELIGRPPDVAVHLTGVGTTRWFEAAGSWGRLESMRSAWAEATVVARGVKAAAALRRYELRESWRPVSETSEEIAGWLGEHLPSRGRVAVQLHGGRLPTEIAEVCAARGAVVVEAVSYRWGLPIDLGPPRRMVSGIADGLVDVIVVTAGAQVVGLLAVAGAMGATTAVREAMAERVVVAAVGSVTARTLLQYGVDCDYVADPPRLGILIRDLAARLPASQARDRALPA